MNNPFQPATEGAQSAVAPATSGFLANQSAPEVNPKPAMLTDSERKARLASAEDSSSGKEKKGWWKFWASSETKRGVNASSKVAKVVPKESDLNRALERKLSEREQAENRHKELLKSVDSMCRTLEKTQNRPIDFNGQDILPPIPVENIEALTASTEQVSGVLQSIKGQLDSAGRRDDRMIESISKVDTTLGSLQRVNEKSITAMDGLQQIMGGVSTAVAKMQSELGESTKRYKGLCERMHDAETAHSTTVAKLQQRTLILAGMLGIGLIASLIALALS